MKLQHTSARQRNPWKKRAPGKPRRAREHTVHHPRSAAYGIFSVHYSRFLTTYIRWKGARRELPPADTTGPSLAVTEMAPPELFLSPGPPRSQSEALGTVVSGAIFLAEAGGGRCPPFAAKPSFSPEEWRPQTLS